MVSCGLSGGQPSLCITRYYHNDANDVHGVHGVHGNKDHGIHGNKGHSLDVDTIVTTLNYHSNHIMLP